MILRQDVAQVVVGVGQQGFQIKYLVEPVARPLVFVLFFGRLRLAPMPETKQQPIHEVIERCPTAPAAPVPVL